MALGAAGGQHTASRLLLDSYFISWFSRQETQRLVSAEGRGTGGPRVGERPRAPLAAAAVSGWHAQEIGGRAWAMAAGRALVDGAPQLLPLAQVLELLDDVKHGRKPAPTSSQRRGGSPSNQVGRRRSLPPAAACRQMAQLWPAPGACAVAELLHLTNWSSGAVFGQLGGLDGAGWQPPSYSTAHCPRGICSCRQMAPYTPLCPLCLPRSRRCRHARRGCRSRRSRPSQCCRSSCRR